MKQPRNTAARVRAATLFIASAVEDVPLPREERTLALSVAPKLNF